MHDVTRILFSFFSCSSSSSSSALGFENEDEDDSRDIKGAQPLAS